MARNIQAEEKLEAFINKLESLGYEVRKISKRPQIYSINGNLVNIRSRGKSKEIAGGRGFWYSIAFSVLKNVKWVIYLTTDSDHFMMLPSSFLESRKDRMYPDRSKAGVGIFDIDFDSESLVLKEGKLERIGKYYWNLNDREDIQDFEEVINA